MYRHELKFIINNGSARVLKGRLEKICKHDENADMNGQYQVTSLYFDDYCDSALNANLQGRLQRKKFRIRVYNGYDGFIRLERKTKNNYGGLKDSLALSKEQYYRVMNGDYSFLQQIDNIVANDFLTALTTRLLRPRIVVDYQREAFIYEPGNVRITFDKYIRGSVRNTDLFDANTLFSPAFDSTKTILEVKFTGFLPGHIKDLIQQDGLGLRQSASKYTMCRLSAS